MRTDDLLIPTHFLFLFVEFFSENNSNDDNNNHAGCTPLIDCLYFHLTSEEK